MTVNPTTFTVLILLLYYNGGITSSYEILIAITIIFLFTMTVLQKMKKINSKIPGFLPPLPKTEIDGRIENLATKSLSELLDLRDRQLKLINNKAFTQKLADKGAKIRAFYDRIVLEIKDKEVVEHTSRLFSDMNLNHVDHESLEHVEWEGKVRKHENTYLDSDDDSEPEDVFHILSHKTSFEKKVKVLQPEKPLITTEDLLSIGEIPYVKHIVEKTEVKSQKSGKEVIGQFKPYKTTISDVHNPEKEIQRKRNKHWEVTAATPPPIIHGPAKTLSLEESLNLQMEQNKHLKEIEAKYAAEKLLARTGVKMFDLPENTSKFGNYRSVESDDTRSDDSDVEGSDKEVLDEEPERGGVVFTVHD